MRHSGPPNFEHGISVADAAVLAAVAAAAPYACLLAFDRLDLH